MPKNPIFAWAEGVNCYVLYNSSFRFSSCYFQSYLFAWPWSTICFCVDVIQLPICFTGTYLSITKAKVVFGFILKTRGKRHFMPPDFFFIPITGLLLCKVFIKNKIYFYKNTCILILSRKIIYTFWSFKEGC